MINRNKFYRAVAYFLYYLLYYLERSELINVYLAWGESQVGAEQAGPTAGSWRRGRRR